jgi:uncharacterized CHY-type Zn-finger protein
MRIIENKYQDKEQEYEITCPHCMSKLAYTFDDVVSDGFNNEWIYCGVCSEQITIWEDDTLTEVTYPQDFHSYANAVKVKDSETNEWIKKCVGNLDKDTDYYFMASGDTIVFAFKSDEDVPSATVVVAKKYQETDVKISRKNF